MRLVDRKRGVLHHRPYNFFRLIDGSFDVLSYDLEGHLLTPK